MAGLIGHLVFLSPAIAVEISRDNAAGVFRTYQPREGTLTKAPRGYKPFYISHYGRHGSRYHTSDGYFAPGIAALQKADEAGLLTSVGKSLLADMQKVADETKTMYGMLSPRGAKEHQGISNRMFKRFRRVFRARDRRIVHCESTLYPRCITSMASFATQLKGNNSKLEIEYCTGQKFHDSLLKEYNFGAYPAFVQDSLIKANFKSDALFSRLFTDPSAACSVIGDTCPMLQSIYGTGAICGCIDYLGVDVFSYLTDEELSSLALSANAFSYGKYGNSLETGDLVTPSAAGLLRDFVYKADEAMEPGSKVAANLRFGHDSSIMPLFNLIRIEGNDKRYHIAEAYKNWMAHEMVPMCTNFQMVFYKNKKGNVLVKVLYNEAESSFPALKAVSGPYYEWKELREYLLSCLPEK